MNSKFQYCNNADCIDCIQRKKCLAIIPISDVTHRPFLIYKNKICICPIITSNEYLVPNTDITYIVSRTISYMYLTTLDISHNNIGVLPIVPSLKKLKCANCNLTTLPNVSSSQFLEELDCSDNGIKVIPNYPSIITLHCSKNLISELPPLKNIKHLVCSDNPITDVSLPNLTYLEAYNCPILVSHKIPSLLKRSSYLNNTGLRWVITQNQKIEKNKLIINWNNNIGRLSRKSKFWVTLERYLFKSDS
jgi:hypothetical protein